MKLSLVTAHDDRLIWSTGGVIIRRLGETSAHSDTLFNNRLTCTLLELYPDLRFEKQTINFVKSEEK
jgi:hypothetical protein